jgi:hypothetical protein
MEYNTPELENSITRRFIVNEVGGRTYDSQLKTTFYNLHCLSEEVLAHSNQLISRDLSSDEISNEIKRIITNDIGSKKKV